MHPAQPDSSAEMAPHLRRWSLQSTEYEEHVEPDDGASDQYQTHCAQHTKHATPADFDQCYDLNVPMRRAASVANAPDNRRA